MYKYIKHDDRGLSLVELLVAVVILALVAVPLGRSFVTAARISARSEAMGDAAEAARNVTEAVVAMGMDDIYAMMKDETPLHDWSVTDAATYSADKDPDTAPPNDPMTSTDPVYRFKLQGVEYASRRYDAVVTLRADLTKNDAPIPQYTPMDAVFNQGTQLPDPDADANIYFDELVAALHGTASDKQRTITLTLSGDEKRVAANITYKYTCTVTLEGKPLSSLDVSRSYSVVGESSIDNDGKAPAIYIMYEPYNTSNDSFTINCDINAAVFFPVFLVAQQPLDVYNAIVTGRLDNAKIYSNVPITGATNNAGKVEIYASESIDRLYSVTVELYAPGEADTGDSIYLLDTAKMD